MTSDRAVNPLDALHPHDPDMDAAQQAWLLATIQPDHRVLDLGCGAGRTLVPLAEAGASCTGVDRDQVALAACRESLERTGCSADLVTADFGEWLPKVEDTWDMVCCLGNTLCLLWQVEEAMAFLGVVRRHLAPGGLLVVDDIPGDLWPEVVEGRWQEGLDPEHGCQMVWSEDDAVFTFRDPSRADADNWDIGSGDVPMRLWTAGALHLAAIAAGYEVPLVPNGSGVRVLRPVPSSQPPR